MKAVIQNSSELDEDSTTHSSLKSALRMTKGIVSLAGIVAMDSIAGAANGACAFEIATKHAASLSPVDFGVTALASIAAVAATYRYGKESVIAIADGINGVRRALFGNKRDGTYSRNAGVQRA